MGLQLLFFSFSLRSDWLSLFENDGNQIISRDLSEALLSAQSHFIPRLGWLVQGGAALGLNELTILNIAFVMIVLNLAAFGTEVLPFLNKITLYERPEVLQPASQT